MMHVHPIHTIHGQGAGRSQADDALRRARATQEELESLRGQLDRLQMICEVMWTLLKANAGTGDDELARVVEEIDLRDGKQDGRAAPKPQPCSECHRVVSVRTSVCLYWGKPNDRPGVF